MARLMVDFWALEIRLELTWLRSYLTEMERHLAALPGNPPEVLRNALDDPAEEVRHPAQQEWSALSEDAAPRIARGSYVVALYAAYESAVTELADKVRRRVGAELALEDIRGRSFTDRARIYFDKVLGIPLCPDAGRWSIVGEVTLVRHLFAHANGRVAALTPRGRRLVEAMQQRGDARKSFGSILLESRYLNRALDTVDESLRDLIERTKTPRLGAGSAVTDFTGADGTSTSAKGTR